MKSTASVIIRVHAWLGLIIGIIASFVYISNSRGGLIIGLIILYGSLVLWAALIGFAEIIENTNAIKHNTEEIQQDTSDVKRLLYKSETFEETAERIQEQNKTVITLDDIDMVGGPLTHEELSDLPGKVLGASIDWWTKSPSTSPDTVITVKSDGEINYYGASVDNDYVGYRPILYLRSSLSINMELYDTVQIKNTNDEYYYIKVDNKNRYVLLSKDVLKNSSNSPFTIPFKVDRSTNDYNISDLQDFIKDWATEWYFCPINKRDDFLIKWKEIIKQRKQL